MSEPEFKFIAVPFAELGDKSEIPISTDPSGNASYEQGWGEDYERNPVDDALAKRIERGMMNRLFNTLTVGLRQYQIASYPVWVDAITNAGAPLNYPNGARVRYENKVYASVLDGDNNSEPTKSDTWVIDDPFDFNAHVASLSEVLSGLINNKIVTPATFVQAHREQPFSFTQATGEPNDLIAKFSPAVQRLTAGTTLFIQASQSNTGNVTLKVEDLPAYPVLGVGGVQLPAGSLTPRGVMQVIFTGNEFLSPNLSRASEQFFGITRLASRAETALGDNSSIALTPRSTAAAVQNGSWTFGVASFDLNKITVSLTPQPDATPEGFSLTTVLPTDYQAGMELSVGAIAGFSLFWTSGLAVSSGQLSRGDLVHIVRVSGGWRVVNTVPASQTRLGMLRTATVESIAAETGADRAVTSDLFATGVRSTPLRTLSSGVDRPLVVSDTVVQAFSNVQAQLNQKGGLSIPNRWTGLNIFDNGVIDVRAGVGVSKSLAFKDTDGRDRARVIAGTDNLLRLQTFASGVKAGSDLTFSGTLLAKDNDAARRFINRDEAATIEETAAMQTWEKYVTPAALAALGNGVVRSEVFGWQVFTIGGVLRIVIGALDGRRDWPANFWTGNPVIVASLSMASPGDVVTQANVSRGGISVSGVMSRDSHGGDSRVSANFIVIGWCGANG